MRLAGGQALSDFEFLAGGPAFDFESPAAASFAHFFSAKRAGFDPSYFTSMEYSLLTGTYTNANTYDPGSKSGFRGTVEPTASPKTGPHKLHRAGTSNLKPQVRK